MDKDTVEIDRDEYARLLMNNGFLQCLYSAGVESWEGYELAQEMFNDGA